MKTLKLALNIVDCVSEWSGRIISYFIFILIFIMVLEVFMRYILNSPTLWVHDTSSMIFGTIIVIGGAYVLKENAHVNVDLIWSRLPVRWRAVVDLITYSLFFVFVLAMFWKGIGLAARSWRVLEVTQNIGRLPVYPVKTMIPVGAFLILLQGVAKYIRTILIVVTGREQL
jgi:TRAP-type mannitol/chloroaromatic compound transport system permease small subunit